VQARGGSKSIPRKNVRLLAGHPLIAYSIAAGLQAHRVTRVIVSTDDPELASVAREYDAEVPFMRPKELAQDETPDLPLFQHALYWLRENESYKPDIVVQLRPTSPLRPPDLVDHAVERLLADPRADSVRGVTVANQTPYKMWRVQECGFIRPLLDDVDLPEPYNMPRQSLPKVYWQTGHVDAIRRETMERYDSLTGELVLSIVVDRPFCIDIDSDSDWAYVEWTLSQDRLAIIKPRTRTESSQNAAKRCLPKQLSLLVLDFDGVLTDNRVWVTEQGLESVACNRGDGLGIEILQRHGIEVFVLSKECNPVVAARCAKLGVRHRQGVEDKQEAMQLLATECNVSLDKVVYVGNDVNDLPCIVHAGCGVAVADAHPEVLKRADLVLKSSGGMGAIRELCDLITTNEKGMGGSRRG
jgi:N-acylneuraminate cytidylyltransferase